MEKHVDLEIQYEEIKANKLKQVERILNILKLKIEAKELLNEVEKLPIPKKGHDEKTQYWENHITDGGCYTYNKTIPDKIEEIEIEFGNWIEELGYVKHEYLFVISCNNSGSTLLYKILNTSPNGSALKDKNGIIEGFQLPECGNKYGTFPNEKELGIFSINSEKI